MTPRKLRTQSVSKILRISLIKTDALLCRCLGDRKEIKYLLPDHDPTNLISDFAQQGERNTMIRNFYLQGLNIHSRFIY